MSTYTVKGDTIYSIAKAHGITEAALLAVNPGVTTRTPLHVGQVLNLPGPVVVPTPTPTPTPAPTPTPTPNTINMKVTWYGWPDNSPPGGAISYPGLHQTAGGVGTYADPITFATDIAEIPRGTRIYIAAFQKYFIMEDNCADSTTEWNANKSYHVDLWIGGEGVNVSTVLAAEDRWTHSSLPVLVNPPSTEPVNATPMLNLP